MQLQFGLPDSLGGVPEAARPLLSGQKAGIPAQFGPFTEPNVAAAPGKVYGRMPRATTHPRDICVVRRPRAVTLHALPHAWPVFSRARTRPFSLAWRLHFAVPPDVAGSEM